MSTEGATFTTPTKRTAFSVAEAGPSRSRPAGASPAYSSRRHSLYGVEDRIIIDPGSRIWKVGFSGETEPRACFWATDDDDESEEMWGFDLGRMRGFNGDRDEGDRLVGVRMVKKLRETFFKHLLTDPKQRKVIIVENTFMPTFVKDHVARTLFDNLKAPSISFTPSSLLALAACGRVTGLVVDIGWLETTITPVYHSRPLYYYARTTPLAGRTLHSHLRELLIHYATYIPPATSMSTIRDREPATVPPRVLTDTLIERILTESCFVGGVLLRSSTVAGDGAMQEIEDSPIEEEMGLQVMEARDQFEASSTAASAAYPVATPDGGSKDIGYGSLIVPGWIRERAAEILFPEDKVGDEEGVPDAILSCLLKLPVDLRLPLIGNLLITGGTSSLPGLIPRLKISLLRALLPPSSTDLNAVADDSPLKYLPRERQMRIAETKEWRYRHLEPYKPLYGLAGSLAILNDPSPVDGAGGRAPRWVPSLMSWVGGSLAGALKTGAPEILREDYDHLQSLHNERGLAYNAALSGDAEVEKEIAALVGVSVEDLRPGMAVEGMDRKRGWRDGVSVGDWSMGMGIRAG